MLITFNLYLLIDRILLFNFVYSYGNKLDSGWILIDFL